MTGGGDKGMEERRGRNKGPKRPRDGGRTERGVGRPGGDQGIEDRGEWEAIVTLWGIAREMGGRRGEWRDGRDDREDVGDSKRCRRTAWAFERRLGGS